MLLRSIFEERRRQPQRLVTPDEPADLPPVSLPPRIIGPGAGPMIEVQNRLKQVREGIVKEPDHGIAIGIRKNDFGPMIFPPLHVPEMSRRYAADVYAS